MSTNNLRALRKRLGLRQADLASAIGVSKGNISHYECQRQLLPPTVAQRIIVLAAERGLHVSYDDIYVHAQPATEEATPDVPDR